jgi:hypothetical protein
MKRFTLRLFSMMVFVCTASRAADSLDDAKKRYDEGVRLYELGEFEGAALEFSKADELAPSDVALATALKAAHKSRRAPLVLNLVERVSSRTSEPSTQKLAAELRAEFRLSAGAFSKGCLCEIRVDNVELPSRQVLWVVLGKHSVELSENGRISRFEADANPGVVQTLNAPPAAPHAPERLPPLAGETESKRLPAVAERERGTTAFWLSLGVTGVSTGLLTWSSIDAAQKHTQFVSAPSFQLSAQGRSAELRTNIFIGTTLISAVVTGVIAYLVFAPSKKPTRASSHEVL